MTRALIYGISGATWDRIDPLLKAGRMPNLKRLIDGGCRGTLASARPEGDKHYRPQTAWPSIATGCDPDHHGVTRFFHRADDLQRPALWDVFNKAGQKVGLFGWPITWPVPHVDGFVVPGYDGRDPSAWPAELSALRSLDRRQEGARGGSDSVAQKLKVAGAAKMIGTLLSHGTRPGTLLTLAKTAVAAKLSTPPELKPLRTRAARLDVNVDLFMKLYNQYQPGLAGFVTFLVDYASHRFWMFSDAPHFADAPQPPEPALKDALDQAYADVDRALGHLLGRIGDAGVVAVVSEHGMAAEPVSAEIGPAHWVMRPNALRSFVGLDEAIVAAPVARWIAFQTPANRMDEVAGKFEAVKIDGTDAPLFQVYRHRDEVIVKLALIRGGPVEDMGAIKVRYGEKVVPFTDVAQKFGRRRSAMHAADAVMVLNGPGIKKGFTVEGARVTDVMPTLLKAVGLRVPEGLDGRVLDVFGG